MNTLYSEPYDYLAVEYGKVVCKESRTIIGFEIGMCNIAGRKGLSEWQWVWFETLLSQDKLEDDTQFMFRNRYSQVNGKNHQGWRESMNAENTIEVRMSKQV